MTAIKKTLRTALVKAVPLKWQTGHNRTLFAELFDRAVDRGADIVCTHECFLDGYMAPDSKGFTNERFLSVAESAEGGDYIGRIRGLAAKHGVHIVFGFTEAGENGWYNAAAFVGPDGGVIGIYRKTHLLDHDKVYLPGDSFPVWDTPLGKTGVMICADRRWPETARTLKVKGAELIMNPAYGMRHLDNEWWMRTRSYENVLYICFADSELSLISGPNGEISARIESSLPDVLVHDIDLARATDAMFSHRRNDN